jgi:carboxypeptidase Q
MRKLPSFILLTYFLFITVLGLPALTIAQETIDTGMIRRIREEGLNHSQIPAIAHQITDVAGSRLTNSPGFRRASDWIIRTLTQWGLSQAHSEAWGEFGYGWSLEKSYAAMKSPYYTTLLAYPAPWSGSTDGLVSAPVILLQKMDSAYLAENALSFKGKILLVRTADTVLPGDFKPDAMRYTDSSLEKLGDTYMITPEMVRFYIPQLLKMIKAKEMIRQSGPLAMLEISREGRDGTVFVDGLGGYRKRDQPAIPYLVLGKEDYLKIERLLEGGTNVQLELDIRAKLYSEDLQGHNVLAEIPGTDPVLKSETVMLGGHLDSWETATGATDNGAGCIVAMEAIRMLKVLGVKPKRTIRISLWDGEEEGLLGSFHYVKNHFGDPADMKLKAEQAKISAYYNLDNGSGKIRGIFAQGNEKVVPIFTQWLEPFKDLGASDVSMHNTGSTDHLSFDAVGIPGFQFIQDPLDYETRSHHSNMDNYDHLSMDDLKQAAVILAAFVYNTAMRPDMLPRKPLTKPQKFIFDGFLP